MIILLSLPVIQVPELVVVLLHSQEPLILQQVQIKPASVYKMNRFNKAVFLCGGHKFYDEQLFDFELNFFQKL